MALQMGEVEVKIKANIDDAKSTLQELEGADVEINATVTVDDSELSEILDGAHEVKITAVNDTGEGVEEANSSLETVEDKQSDITAEDSTAEGVDAANASLENVEDTSADITAEDSTAEGVDAANASLETVDDTSAAITAIDNTAEAVDSATTALSGVEDEDVDITATDNTGDVIDGIESNLDAIEDESLTITAEDETGDIISTIETNLSAIEDEGVTITAEDDTGSTISTIESNLSAIEDEGVTITAEDETEGTIETISSNLSAIEDEGVVITAEDNTGSTIETISSNLDVIEDEGVVISAEDNTGATIADIEATLAAIQDEEVTITAEADTSTAESDIAEVENADYSATVEADADTESAEEELGSLEGEATVTAEADTAEAETELNSLNGDAIVLAEADTIEAEEELNSLTGLAEIIGDASGLQTDLDEEDLSATVDLTVNAEGLVDSVTSAVGSLNIASAIGSAITSAISGIWKSGKKVFNWVYEIATGADDAATAAAIMGTTYGNYKKMQWMADQVDVDPETLQSTSRTVKSDLERLYTPEGYAAGSKEYNAALKKWYNSTQFKALGGLATSGNQYQSGYKTAEQAMSELGSAEIMQRYMEYIVKNSTKENQEKLITELFGTRGAYITPLINAMRDGTYDALNERFTSLQLYKDAMSDDTRDKLLGLSDAVANCKSAFNAFKDTVAAKLAPFFTTLIDNTRSAFEEAYEIITDKKGNKIRRIWDMVKEKFGSVWNDLKSWAVNDIWPIISEVIAPIGKEIGDAITRLVDKLKIALVDIFAKIPLIGGAFTTKEDLAEDIADEFKAKNEKNGYEGFASPQEYVAKYGTTGITSALTESTDKLLKFYEDNYDITDLNRSRVEAQIMGMLKSGNYKTWAEFSKAVSNFDFNTNYFRSQGSSTTNTNANTNGTKTNTTPTTQQLTDAGYSGQITGEDARYYGILGQLQTSTTAVESATTACSNAVSALENVEFKSGDVSVSVPVTVNTTGTVDTVTHETHVQLWTEDKKTGKVFANGSGRGK